MRRYLGSRRRFLYRVVVYALLPFVGLFVFLSEYELLEGRLLGMIGMTVGIGAWLLLFSRVQDPKSAFRFALQPRRYLRGLLERWEPSYASSSDSSLELDGELNLEVERRALREYLEEALPDVSVGERAPAEPVGADPGRAPVALEVAEELLVVLSLPPSSPQDWEVLKEHLEGLRTPLREEPILLVFLGKAHATGSLRDKRIEILVK